MAVFRVCKTFTVESGHLLSKHAERCRYPHGHTRTIEVVVSSEKLNDQGMVVDFKALKLAAEDYINRYDHAMAINSEDPLLPGLKEIYPPEALVVFDHAEPTTEAIARDLYGFIDCILREGFLGESETGAAYEIPAGQVRLERVRVWETPTSWAEYGE